MSLLKVNELNEFTADTGVTIEGILLKDGVVGSGMPTINAAQYAGATAGAKIAAAIAALPSTGGVVDARSIIGAQSITQDIFADAGQKRPIVLLFGPATYTVTAGQIQNVPSYCTIELNGTTFITSNGSTVTNMFATKVSAAFVSCTEGDATIDPSSPTDFDVGDVVIIFGHVPRGGRDNTQLNGALDSSSTTITVDSTTGFNATGYLRIDDEVITYTGKTATTFTGCARGAEGTSAASHLDNAAVDRPVYDKYIIATNNGDGTYEVDRVVTAPTSTAMTSRWGSTGIRFLGNGLLDGDKPATSAGNNGIGIYALAARKLYVEPGVRFEHWATVGVQTVAALDCVIDGYFEDIGYRGSTNVGAAVWPFQNSQRITVLGDYYDVNIGVFLDDRTTGPGLYDNPVEDCVILPRSIDLCYYGVYIEGGCNNNSVKAPKIKGFTASNAVAIGASVQWITASTPTGNVVEVGEVSPLAGAIGLESNAVDGNNTMICRTPGALAAGTGYAGNTVLLTPAAPMSADRGDADVTLVHSTDAPTQRFATTLTANRTVTLSSSGAVPGARFRVVRTGLGAFTMDVGGLKTIPSATAAFVEVEHDGTAWRLTGYGTL